MTNMSKRVKRYTAPEFTLGAAPGYARHAQALRHSNAAGPHTDRRRGKGNRSNIDRVAITASQKEAA
jgi:hypothetical protein